MNNILSKTILVLVLLVIGYFLLPYVKPNQRLSNVQDQNNTSDPGVQKFTSEKLGITFQYYTDQDGNGETETGVSEQDDKVYVYYLPAPVTEGQWVQSFTKNPDEDLDTAIKNMFLKGISETDCYITEYPISETPQENIVTRQIAYPIDSTDPNATLEELMKNRAKCPQDYSLTNGIQYFWMDKNHPDKFFFFAIGQYGILAESYKPDVNLKTWQDTFQVIN
jgi:hypothetical protein